MNDRVQRLEQLVELARGLAHDDFSLPQMCRRMQSYLNGLAGVRDFHVAIARDDGPLHPEFSSVNGAEVDPQTPASGELQTLALRHADREVGTIAVDSTSDRLQAAQPDLDTALDFFALAIANVRKLRATESRIDRDNLTGLYNRNYGLRRLKEELQRAESARSKLCTLIVDVDGVEELNTRYGHQTGDSAIRTVGDALKSICRHSDVLCRFAGDRFLLIYPNFGDGDATPVARRVRTQIEMRVLPVPGGAIGLHASIGSSVAGPGADVNGIIAQTERDLLRDKAERRRRTPT